MQLKWRVSVVSVSADVLAVLCVLCVWIQSCASWLQIATSAREEHRAQMDAALDQVAAHMQSMPSEAQRLTLDVLARRSAG